MIETGLDISDVIPKETYQGDFLAARFEYFDFFNIQIVTEQADYTNEATQRLMLDMHAGKLTSNVCIPALDWPALTGRNLMTELVALRNDDGSSYLVEPPPAFWLSSFIAWVSVAETAEPPRPQRLSGSGLIPAVEFYDYYYAWLADDSITVAAITAQDFNYTCSSVVAERLTASGPVECAAGERGDLTYAFVSIYLDGLDTTDDFTAMITSVRAVCDKYVDLGLPNFPYGQPFTFWEQYVNIWEVLLQNIAASLAVRSSPGHLFRTHRGLCRSAAFALLVNLLSRVAASVAQLLSLVWSTFGELTLGRNIRLYSCSRWRC